MTYSKFYKLFFKVSISAVVKLALKFLVYSSHNSWGAGGRATEGWEGELELEMGRWGRGGGAQAKRNFLIVEFVFIFLSK